jgi:hypothetical protein
MDKKIDFGYQKRFCSIKKTFNIQHPDKIPEIIDGEYFDMTHTNHGVAVILNHKYFEKMNTRQGTTKDCKDIESTLKALHFDVHVCTDYNYEGKRIKTQNNVKILQKK